MSTTTKAVLLSLQNSAPLEVLVLYFYGEMDVRVNHVLKLVTTSHLTILGHLSDDDDINGMLFCIRGEQLKGPFGRR